MSRNIDHILHEDRVFPPPAEFAAKASIRSREEYEALHRRSVEDPEGFWAEEAGRLDWFRTWDRVLDWNDAPFARWFDGGLLNASYNCLDRHLETRGDKPALVWEGEPGDRRTLTYRELHAEVCRFANALKALGVGKGDTVAVYMPLVPELAIAVLACARIGAIHSVIFGGFSAPALVDRINDAASTVVVTADGGWRRGQVVPLKSIVDEALKSTPSVKACVVLRRTGQDVPMVPGRDAWWHDVAAAASADCPAEPLPAEHPLFVLYTSGSTGKPKGILHTTGGYLLGATLTTRHVFDLRDDDVYWCTADVGWVTGHSYVVYGPLSNGATVVLYEGAPNHPGPDRFWEIVARHRVTIFYTAPTAIRAFMKWGDAEPAKHDLSSLRLLGSVGEPINPEAWMWYHRVIGGGRCPIVDTWWQTETGSIAITPLPGVTHARPGSAMHPFFGIDAAVVDEQGNELPHGQGGFLVIRKPWPSMLRTLWGDPERFKDVYWKRFAGKGYYLAGDGAVRDADGAFWILGRIDDVLNVSGHRLSTMEIESALVAHEAVVEAAVVGFPHEIKGEGVSAFVTLGPGHAKQDALKDALRTHVREQIGAIAAPDQIHFTDALPKTRSGKIMRRLLRDVAAGVESKGDMTTLEDLSILAKLREKDEE